MPGRPWPRQPTDARARGHEFRQSRPAPGGRALSFLVVAVFWAPPGALCLLAPALALCRKTTRQALDLEQLFHRTQQI